MKKAFNKNHLILFLTGFIIAFPFGFMGIMPLDQSYIFEGASKLYFGEKPFHDFYMPFGFVPVYIQFVLFKIFGINWLSYVIHAAFFNGLFTVLTYRFLSFFTNKRIFLWFLSIISSVFFYPLCGTPQAENHVIYFSFLAFYFLIRSMHDNDKYAYFIVPVMLTAFLSKQNPSSFFLLAMFVFALANFKLISRSLIIKAGYGILISLSVIVLLLFLYDFEKMVFYSYELPRYLVNKRLNMYPLEISSFTREIFKLGFSSMLIIPLMILSIIVLRKKDIGKLKTNLIFGMLYISILFASIMTYNQHQLYIPIIFIIYGLIILNLLAVFEKKLKIIFSILLVSTVSVDLALNTSFILERRYNDLVFEKSSFQNFDKDLGFFFQASGNYQMESEDIHKLFDFLEKNEGNFLYIGDLLIINGLLENVSPMPSIFYHQGISQPVRYTPEFHEFNLKLYERMKKLNTKYIIIENAQTYSTWNQMSVFDFFQRDLIESFDVIRLGYFDVLLIREIPSG